MTTRKIRWGILGVARINDRLLPSFAKLTNGELVGIASRSLEKAQKAARSVGIPRAFGSYEALLDDPSIDAVYNPLPNNLHAEWTRKAADRGKHVLCEKPLTPTAAEAIELVAYCRSKKIVLMDGFHWPHHPRTKKIRELLDRGDIGPVRRVGGAFTFRMAELNLANIRLQPDLGGGSLLDVGCYPIYGIRWAMQVEPTRVFATARYVNDVDVEMTGTLWFPGGEIASFDCGFTHPYRGWLEIAGTTGTIFLHDPWQPSPACNFEIRRDGKPSGTPEVHTVEAADQIHAMLENFGAAILTNTPASPSIDEAVKTLRVLDALAKSARTNAIVDVA
jgi:D-xylose 1-dehydrogenase (NADP+, D-xylono-1,5-lactone-forming)